MVHEAAIAQLSEPLARLLTGELVEAQAGCTTWKEVRKGTFERFVQFAYQGDYEVVEPELLPDKKTIISEEEPMDVNSPEGFKVDEGFYASRSKIKGVRITKRISNWDSDDKVEEPHPEEYIPEAAPYSPVEEPHPEEYIPAAAPYSPVEEPHPEEYIPEAAPYSPSPPPINFQNLSYRITQSLTPYTTICTPPTNYLPRHTYEHVFLSHAHLYVLADYWLIAPLKTLALSKLHKTLWIFEIDERNTPDVLALARYAYREEGRGSEEGIGGLRELVCKYLVTHAVTLTANEGFMGLLTEGGEFAGDMWREEVQRNH
jgi:hypothetical protein